MLHPTKSIIFRQLIFVKVRSLENGFAGRMNSFAGRIWPAGRSLVTPDIEECAQKIEVNDDEEGRI